MKSIIDKFSFVSCKYNKLILLGSIILMIAAGFIASRLTMDSSMENLLSEDNKVIAASRNFEKEFGSQDNVLIAVKGDAEKTEKYLDALAQKITNDKIAVNVFYKIDSSSLEEYAPLYIPKDNYLSLDKELDNPDSPLARFIAAPDLSNLSDLLASRLESFPEDKRSSLVDGYSKILLPESSEDISNKDFSEFFASLIFGYFDADSLKTNSNYLVSDSKNMYLMIIKPKVEMSNFIESRDKFFSKLKENINSLLEKDEFSGLEAGFTGGTFVQDYEADMVAFDNFFSTALITFILILAFIVLSFRRLFIPLSSGLPLILGTLLAAAFVTITYGSINLFSISFAALLLGLGIDFAIHITARYLEERSKGADLKDALSNTLKSTGMGMFIGALTTAIAFGAFVLAQFKAFTQMGIIIGAGIMLSFITMIIIMPSIISFFDGKVRSRKPPDTKFSFLAPLGKLIQRRPWAFVIAGLILIATLYVPVSRTTIITDMSAVYPDNMSSSKWLDIVEKEFDYDANTFSIMADDMDELRSWLEQLKKKSSIKSVNSILDFMPQDQDMKTAVINKLLKKQKSASSSENSQPDIIKDFPMEEYYKHAVNNIKSNITLVIDKATSLNVPQSTEGVAALQELVQILNNNQSFEYLNKLQTTLEKQKGLIKNTGFEEIKPITVHDLPDELKSGYVGKTGKLLIEVLPHGNIWDNENLQTFKSDISEITGSLPVGMPVLMNEVVNMVKKDAVKISIIAVIIIFLLLLLIFKSIKTTLISIIPAVLTIYCTLGMAKLLGIDINIINLMAFPLIIGIGIDSAVHLTHRLSEENKSDIPDVLVHTGKAVTMTTITTLFGFGSFMFANHPGLASMGKTVVIGMTICLILSLSLLPSLHVLLSKNKQH